MLKNSMYKVFTFINCGRRVELPDKLDYRSGKSFAAVMDAQILLEKGIQGKASKKHLETLRHYPNILALISKYHGKFFRWRRDINTGVIIVEVVFEDLNNLYGYGYDVARFPHISSKYVYSAIFDGKSHVSTSPKDMKYPKRMSLILEDAAEDEASEIQKMFYYELATFCDFIDEMPKHKVKTFKNRDGFLVVDVSFRYFLDFETFKKAMENWNLNMIE